MIDDTSRPGVASAARPAQPAAASAELEEFLYIITHDLRAAFRAFQTIPEWIEEDMGPLPPDRAAAVEAHLAMLMTQARRCDRMLLDLRDYSRIGRRADSLGEHPVDAVLSQALIQSPLPRGFSFSIEGGGLLSGPGNELVLLFAALLSNAVKHHDRENGRITLKVSGAGPMRQLRFSDDGPGIPAQFHEAVFDPLRTLRPRDDCEGSGMGLPIARKIVRRLGGEIAVARTAAPRGTTLAFTLPGHDPAQPARLN
ncbi:Histidine kinase-, DNA gyrase B-, and HSP90-like ATPase [Pseudooceanicola antarcticus]|uniref:histidine kinase n=1 Tax=Pseudooceanicola antarcticus TaxID=1247613 RepID=A0A285JGH9_9RHOB|nr:HAMP domain-containing sensor histidine kinase [Pseudooceanicola antarcticus]PJE31034.1 sensor histidine kinase [Pseudooceanicola antarcticus]SNY58887.1 Histidine kinase-, DNA gyrase B-, and HSP90-like ATPase [Pseudooceanicola antarcticus]